MRHQPNGFISLSPSRHRDQVDVPGSHPLYAGRQKRMAARKSLSTLPVDIQASILEFLACDDLARFCVVGRACRSVAIMDRLWRPLMARHFADVQHVSRGYPGIMTVLMNLWSFLFSLTTPQIPSVVSSPVFHFRKLALSKCSLCEEFLLPIVPKSETTHPRPHSCDTCKSLCCAACHCQCRLEATNRALQVLPPFDLYAGLYGLPYPVMLAFFLIEANVRFCNAILSELDYF
jgi:hypothetical protein